MREIGWEAMRVAPPVAGADLWCSSTRCTDQKPLCCEGIQGTCEGGTKCVAKAEDCYPTARILGCIGASDCAPGTRCYLSPVYGTACAAASDGITIATCREDAECAKPLRCIPHPDVRAVRYCAE